MSETKRNGPRVTVKLSCFDCRWETSSHYAVQGDSGCDVSCSHPERIGSEARVGDTTWDTPKWCPLRGAALRAAAEGQV